MYFWIIALENLWMFMTMYLVAQNATALKKLHWGRKIIAVLVILVGAPIFMTEKVLEWILELIFEGGN